MSYIEKKYQIKITEIFNSISNLDIEILELFKEKSIRSGDKIAKLCALINKQINLILKRYYPEIKDMETKLSIKSKLKFYYDFIDKLTDFIRHIENFQKLDEKYYEAVIKFIEQKDQLINEKYRTICINELTAFYDKKSRDALEEILAKKLEMKSREYFTLGSLEEEIKKIAKTSGADEVTIFQSEGIVNQVDLIKDPKSMINFSIYSEDEEKLRDIGKAIRTYLISKGFEAIIFIVELSNVISEREVLTGSVITNAKLFPDL